MVWKSGCLNVIAGDASISRIVDRGPWRERGREKGNEGISVGQRKRK